MKRTTDELRYTILKTIERDGKNIESIRNQINTCLPTILNNARILEKMDFLKIHETIIGKRKYREIEITPDGRNFLKKLEKIFQ